MSEEKEKSFYDIIKETEIFNENETDVIKIIKAHNQALIDRIRRSL